MERRRGVQKQKRDTPFRRRSAIRSGTLLSSYFFRGDKRKGEDGGRGVNFGGGGGNAPELRAFAGGGSTYEVWRLNSRI